MSEIYEAVLFDFDGVIVDSEPVHLACWMEALAPFGISLDWTTYCERYIGVDDRLMLASLCAEKDPQIPFEDAWSKYPLKKRLFEERMHANGVVAPEVLDFLRDVHSRFRTAIVTSSARSEVEPILSQAGLLPFVDTAVYGDEVDRHKPAPDPYLLAARRLSVTRALVVEDSPAGCESGRAAGFDVVRIERQAEMCRVVLSALNHQHEEPHQRSAE